jgi:hypothetical protein
MTLGKLASALSALKSRLRYMACFDDVTSRLSKSES